MSQDIVQKVFNVDIVGNTYNVSVVDTASFSVEVHVPGVIAAAGDYAASQITNDSAVAGAFVDNALNTLNTAVGLNTTHRSSDGKNHSDVVLNNTHRSTVVGNPHAVHADDTVFKDGETVLAILNDTIRLGVLDAITVTDDGGLGISWTTGEVYTPDIVETTSDSDTCTDDAVNYLIWASGTGLTLGTAPASSSQIAVATIHCQDGDIWLLHEEAIISAFPKDLQHGLSETMPSLVAFGLGVAEDADGTNSHDVTLAPGEWYKDLHAMFEIAAPVYTRITPMRRWFHTGGVWDSESNAEIDPTFWDNGTAKTAVGVNKYYKSLFIVGDGILHWVYGQVEYNTLAAAVEGTEPDVPPGLVGLPKSTTYIYLSSEGSLGTTDRWADVRPLIGAGSDNLVSSHLSLLHIGTNTHAQIDTHIADVANPHGTTAALISLGNVDNTSDANKPVSTAQQTALDLKLTIRPIYIGGGGVDFNDYKGVAYEGFYRWTSNKPTNTPAGATYSHAFVYYDGSGTSQLIWGGTGKNIFIRRSAGAAWGSWRQVAMIDNLTKAAVGLDQLQNALQIKATENAFSGEFSEVTSPADGSLLVMETVSTGAIRKLQIGNLPHEYMMLVYAENSGGLNDMTYEWSYGANGGGPVASGIPIHVLSGYTCEVVKMSLSIGGGDADVQIVVNGTPKPNTSIACEAPDTHAMATPTTEQAIVDGDLLNFRTLSEDTSSGPCVVCAFLRFYK